MVHNNSVFSINTVAIMIFYNGTANTMKMVLLLYCRAPLTLNINAILKKE